MADNSQDPILYTIDEKVNELAKRIDDSNKAAAAKPQNYGPNGTSVKFYFYDALGNLTGESDIKADNTGIISPEDRQIALDQRRAIFESRDFNGDHKISRKENQMIGPFTNEHANQLISDIAELFRENNVGIAKTTEFANLVNRIAQDGELSVAEEEALQKFFKENHITVQESKGTPSPSPMPQIAPVPNILKL